MAGFGKPKFHYAIDVAQERKALRAHRKVRGLPARKPGNLLLGTWNIANLGAPEQVREPECFDLIAEIVSCFDLLVAQEIRDDATAAREVLSRLPASWRLLFSEAGGNDERFAFYWDSKVVDLGQLVGKVTLEPKELKPAGGEGFLGFSRTPYIGTFHRGDLRLEVVSAHSFFGTANDPLDMARRLSETKALGWWCQERSEDPDSYTKDIIAVGDFNTPSEDDWPLAKQMLDDLRERGLHTPRYERDGDDIVLETQLGTAVRSENHYDHLLFFPENTDADLEQIGVFDFDAVIFHDLWEKRRELSGEKKGRSQFNAFVAWAVSDRRPLWAQFRT